MKTYTTASSARRALKNALAARNLTLDDVQFEIAPEFGSDGMFIVRVSVEIEGFELITHDVIADASELAEIAAEVANDADFAAAMAEGELAIAQSEEDAAFAEELEAEVAATEAAQPSRKGRPSHLSGKRFYAIVTTNVRRPGSLGFATLALVLANPGATYEELVAMGATPGQLNHDEKLQRIRAE